MATRARNVSVSARVVSIASAPAASRSGPLLLPVAMPSTAAPAVRAASTSAGVSPMTRTSPVGVFRIAADAEVEVPVEPEHRQFGLGDPAYIPGDHGLPEPIDPRQRLQRGSSPR